MLKGKIDKTTTMADSLLASQGTAAAEGFKNVSQYWFPQTMPYEKGFELMEANRDSRDDILCPMSGMQPVVSNEKFVLVSEDGREFKMDEWAAKQYCSRIGMPSTVYSWLTEDSMNQNGTVKVKRDGHDAAVLRVNVMNALRHMPKDKKFRFRTYNDSVIRAVLTEDYEIVDNRWYLETLQKCIPGGRLSHWRGDADTMYGNILIPDSIRQETDSEYGGMISIGNCEIGKRRISQVPSLFRAICMNGCIWNQTKGQNIRRVHRGKHVRNLGGLAKEIAANIQNQIPLISGGIDTLLKTQEFAIGDVKRFIAETGIAFGMKAPELRAVATEYVKHESAFRNLFGIINGITRAGQSLSPDRWVEFDTYAGEMAGMNRVTFDRMLKRADNLSDEYVRDAFGMAV